MKQKVEKWRSLGKGEVQKGKGALVGSPSTSSFSTCCCGHCFPWDIIWLLQAPEPMYLPDRQSPKSKKDTTHSKRRQSEGSLHSHMLISSLVFKGKETVHALAWFWGYQCFQWGCSQRTIPTCMPGSVLVLLIFQYKCVKCMMLPLRHPAQAAHQLPPARFTFDTSSFLCFRWETLTWQAGTFWMESSVRLVRVSDSHPEQKGCGASGRPPAESWWESCWARSLVNASSQL